MRLLNPSFGTRYPEIGPVSGIIQMAHTGDVPSVSHVCVMPHTSGAAAERCYRKEPRQRMPRQRSQRMLGALGSLGEQDGAIPDDLKERRPNLGVDIDVGSKRDVGVFVVVDSEGLPRGVACAVWHDDAWFWGSRATGDLVHVVVLGVTVARGEVVGGRIRIFGAGGSGYAVEQLHTVEAEVAVYRFPGLFMIDAVYDHEVVVGGQLKEVRSQIGGVSIFSQKVDIAEYACIALRKPDIRIEMYRPHFCVSVAADYLLPQVF